MTKILDHGYLRVVETWGRGDTVGEAEAGIIEAARQSTQGSFRGWETDEKLLRYLYEHHHDSPFEFAGMTVEVQAPIFVFREWHRHRTQSYNEMSARYAELPDLFYVPSLERLVKGKQSTANKQSSAVGFNRADIEDIQRIISNSNYLQRGLYERLLNKGLARELARLVIPINQYSRMRATANLRNWLAFLTLRMAPEAQWEIRQYANALADEVKTHFPRTYTLFKERV